MKSFFKNILDQSKTDTIRKRYHPNFDSLNELAQLSGIFPWIFDSNSIIAIEAGNTVHRLLTSQSILKDKILYESLRYIDLNKESLQLFKAFEAETQVSLFCIASMNKNGFVREEAVKFLIESPSQQAFTFLLFRLADWVPKIREAAKDAVRSQMHLQEANYLIYIHEIVDGLLKVERTKLQDIHKELIDFIFTEKSRDQILAELDGYLEAERYFIIKNVIAQKNLNQDLFEKFLGDKNYLIRLLAIKNTEFIDQAEILQRLLRDRSQIIRKYAINKIPESDLEGYLPDLSLLLFDNSNAIRYLARHLISKFSNPDFPELYRKALQDELKPGCILGLSEVGDNSDIQIIVKCLDAPLAKQREAALFGISNLDHQLAKKMAFDFFTDSSNAVKKTCVRIITKERSIEDLPRLRIIYDNGNSEIKRFVLKAISKYGGWDIAGDFLKGIMENDEKVKLSSYAFLYSWYNYSIRLGREKRQTDKDYVMGIYREMNFEHLEIPSHIKKICAEIPFIFGPK